MCVHDEQRVNDVQHVALLLLYQATQYSIVGTRYTVLGTTYNFLLNKQPPNTKDIKQFLNNLLLIVILIVIVEIINSPCNNQLLLHKIDQYSIRTHTHLYDG